MLPTQTLNPTALPSTTNGPKTTRRAKRDLDDPADFAEALVSRRSTSKTEQPDPGRWWWLGVGMTAIGGLGYLCFWWHATGCHDVVWGVTSEALVALGARGPRRTMLQNRFVRYFPHTEEYKDPIEIDLLRNGTESSPKAQRFLVDVHPSRTTPSLSTIPTGQEPDPFPKNTLNAVTI